MSSKWHQKTIDQVKAATANAISMGPFGSDIKAENFVTSGIPVIKGGNLNGDFLLETSFDFLTPEKADTLRPSNAKRRDLVITHRGTIGQVGIIPDNSKYDRYVVSQSQLKVSLDQSEVNPYFVYYYLRSPEGQHQLLQNASQVGVPAISRASSSIKAIVIPCPDLETQDKVAAVFLSLDHKIELNHQLNQTLEQMAQALFQSWFVDFEPVQAKRAAVAAGRDPLRAAMSSLSGKTDAELDAMPREQGDALAATAALFPEEMEPSAQGDVPKGWEVSTVGQEVSVQGGGTPSTTNSAYWNGDYAWATPKDLSRLPDKVLTNTERKITEAGVKNISSGQLPVGTVLLSSRAPIGYLALAMVSVSINQGFIAMQCGGRLPNMYVLQWATANLDAIKQRGGGTTFAEISKSNFRPLPVLVPDKTTLTAFQKLTMPLYEQITANVREAESLATLRDALLPKLLSGELTVGTEEAPPPQ